MSEFRKVARDLADDIIVLQCTSLCPQLTPISQALHAVGRGVKSRRIDPSLVSSLLSFESTNPTSELEKNIIEFVGQYKNELELILEQQTAKQQFYSEHSDTPSR